MCLVFGHRSLSPRPLCFWISISVEFFLSWEWVWLDRLTPPHLSPLHLLNNLVPCLHAIVTLRICISHFLCQPTLPNRSRVLFCWLLSSESVCLCVLPWVHAMRLSHIMTNSNQSHLCHCPVSYRVALPVTCQSISQNVGCASPNSSLLINGVTKFWHFVGFSGSCGNFRKRLEGSRGVAGW